MRGTVLPPRTPSSAVITSRQAAHSGEQSVEGGGEAGGGVNGGRGGGIGGAGRASMHVTTGS
ncbi:MAG: hypothetical protein VX121_09155, partial [Pseudomonadota bacterium]|nr:hypothetical protein [Pseudomonadota bacterium]